MKPTYQTIFGGGENGTERGNCFAAALASLLEIDLDRVPNFCNQDDWREATNKWLAQFGLFYVDIAIPPDMRAESIFSFAGYHVISGEACRGFRHSVVGYAGKMVHDPYPGGPGLMTETEYGFLVPLNTASFDDHAEIARLKDWKESASSLIGQWEQIWEALGRPGPLGSSKPEQSLKEVVRLGRQLEEALADDLIYIPGEWQCKHCGFHVSKRILAVSIGKVGVDTKEDLDGCPNDGFILERVTWKEEEERSAKRLVEMMEAQNSEQQESIRLLEATLYEHLTKAPAEINWDDVRSTVAALTEARRNELCKN